MGGGGGRRGPGRGAMLLALGLHAALVTAAWASGLIHRRPELPPFKAYRVNIVSPPPVELGPPEPVAANAPAAATTPVEAPKPAPAPEAKAPPKPEPEKAEPKKAEPEKAEPPKAAPPKTEPARKPQPTRTPAESKQAAPPARPRGADPNPNARSGGDGLNVRIEGDEFPYPAYMDNIIRQISRYFRWTGQSGLSAEIYFVILRDGSVQMSDTQWIRRSGSTDFDFAALEAIEQAGRARAFGSLPDGFAGDRLPISFYFEPAR